MKAERTARLILFALIGLALLAPAAARWLVPSNPEAVVEVHGRLPENGGWTPETLTVTAGEDLRLRLTSDDVMHGFAVGKSSQPSVDVVPGKFSELTLNFAQPGTYTYYCTRWCGPNHWRMRGTIKVEGPASTAPAAQEPLFSRLGLDIDAPVTPVEAPPQARPSAARGAALGIRLPEEYTSADYVRSHSPVDLFAALKAEPLGQRLTDEQVWDLVAYAWRTAFPPEALARGAELYAQNCAACHGETGAGDGVMAGGFSAAQTPPGEPSMEDMNEDLDPGFGHRVEPPTDFSDPARSLALNSARLQGKIIRGGMGTGMPSWGAIFTEADTWALVGYLWSFTLGE